MMEVQAQTHAMKKDAPFNQSSAMKDEIRSSGASGKSRVPKELAPGLYITATPVGNARDITLRALDVLSGADAIIAEDTRVTAKLLTILGLQKPLLAYNDHNASRERPRILARLRAGERLALVSDAGTPLISDPGFKLVREAIASDLPVQVVPGPSALLAALTVSGLPTDKFLFVGFLPPKQGERRRALAEWKTVRATLIVFESAQRLSETLSDMASVLGPRPVSIARELTKLHEEVTRGDLESLAETYRHRDPPRGEITLVVGPPLDEAPDMTRADALIEMALAYMPVRAASDLISEALGAPRRDIYARALALRSREDG